MTTRRVDGVPTVPKRIGLMATFHLPLARRILHENALAASVLAHLPRRNFPVLETEIA
jgi:hypothetical protein